MLLYTVSIADGRAIFRMDIGPHKGIILWYLGKSSHEIHLESQRPLTVGCFSMKYGLLRGIVANC